MRIRLDDDGRLSAAACDDGVHCSPPGRHADRQGPGTGDRRQRRLRRPETKPHVPRREHHPLLPGHVGHWPAKGHGQAVTSTRAARRWAAIATTPRTIPSDQLGHAHQSGHHDRRHPCRRCLQAAAAPHANRPRSGSV